MGEVGTITVAEAKQGWFSRHWGDVRGNAKWEAIMRAMSVVVPGLAATGATSWSLMANNRVLTTVIIAGVGIVMSAFWASYRFFLTFAEAKAAQKNIGEGFIAQLDRLSVGVVSAVNDNTLHGADNRAAVLAEIEKLTGRHLLSLTPPDSSPAILLEPYDRTEVEEVLAWLDEKPGSLAIIKKNFDSAQSGDVVAHKKMRLLSFLRGLRY